MRILTLFPFGIVQQFHTIPITLYHSIRYKTNRKSCSTGMLIAPLLAEKINLTSQGDDHDYVFINTHLSFCRS